MKLVAAIAALLLAPCGGYLYVLAANTKPAASVVQAVVADEGEAVPQPTCLVPSSPQTGLSADYDRFATELARYRRCIEDYVRTRETEVKRHNRLALANADAANVAAQRLADYLHGLGQPEQEK